MYPVVIIVIFYHKRPILVACLFVCSKYTELYWNIEESKYGTLISGIIIHQTHYEKSDWSRAFIQFTIACELAMTNALSAADIAFIMSSSMSAWLLSPLECAPQKQNG